MSFSPKLLIREAAKDVSHKRARWIKIDDKKNNTRRYELVYITGRVKAQRDHVIIRRMNDKEDPRSVSAQNALKKPPPKCMYSGQDIIWFLKWGFRSFIQYQVHHQDDATGAVLQATNAPVIDLDQRNLLKNYKAKLLRQDQEIEDLHKTLEKVSSPKQKLITVQSQNNNNNNYFNPKTKNEQYKLKVEQLSNTIKDHEEKIDHLTAKSIDFNDLNAAYKDSIQSMNAQIERKERNFKSAMNKLSEKLRNSKIRNAQHEDSIHNLTQRLRSANDEITKQKQEIKVIQKQQEETQRNYTQIYVQHEEMQGAKQQALNDLKKFEKRYQTEVARKQSVIDGLRDRCKELKQRKDALKRHNTSLTEANTRMSELRQEDQQQIEQVETLRQQNEELKQDIDEFKELLMMNAEDKDNEVLNDLRNKITEYEQSIEMLKTLHKKEIDSMKAKINAVYEEDEKKNEYNGNDSVEKQFKLFLNHTRMDRYFGNFVENECCNMHSIQYFDDEFLANDIGIKNKIVRKTLQKECQRMKILMDEFENNYEITPVIYRKLQKYGIVTVPILCEEVQTRQDLKRKFKITNECHCGVLLKIVQKENGLEANQQLNDDQYQKEGADGTPHM